MAELTPMMKQYVKIKEENQDCILFFRLGDFYEMFGDDAKTASEELDLVLTTRDRSKENKEDRVPMCGIPYHSSEAYIARLISKGYKVAICEQLEDPALAKGLVERDVVRIITPGTLIDTSMLDESRPNYLCSIYVDGGGSAVCFCDLSTGEISVTEFPAGGISHMINEIASYSPAEAVLNSGSAENAPLISFFKNRLQCLIQTEDSLFVPDTCRVLTESQFKGSDSVTLLSPHGICAVGALLGYMNDTQKTDLSHISNLRVNSTGTYMEIDVQSMRNLELVSSLRTMEKKGSLLWVLDKTKTAMGRRMIRSWVLHPLLSPSEIKRRQGAVNEFYINAVLTGDMGDTLRQIGDIERLVGKIVYGTANGRDMRTMAQSLSHIPEVIRLLSTCRSSLLKELYSMDPLADIFRMIDEAVCDEPPFSVREGGIMRPGYNERVDYLRGLLDNSSAALAGIEQRERERTGKKLKVGYNRVFGYYIEIPRSMSEDVPEDYIRKQTLTNCERFITQELKELETELLNAKDSLADLEYRLFSELREKISGEVFRIQDTAAKLAETDVLCSFGSVAAKNNYCMPEIDLSGKIMIKEGRHPVVELMQTDALFVPNDTHLDSDDFRALIITGPNMAGKSTYMRQTALIVLMAQMGSFVPAKSATVGIVDRVFTRIGASDDLSAGMSTFMVEMTEVSDILKNATSSSLLILDEIGRGTSTYDGMSIARAILEYCADRRSLGAKTMFATHYHELTAMKAEKQGIKNCCITAKKRGGDIIFLRKIINGIADDSYGIEVAGLAGVPDSVIKRAKAILKELESGSAAPVSDEKRRPPDDAAGQLSLTQISGSEVLETLRSTDLNTITPIEAMNLLYSLKKKVQDV
jgi:DNA mismatch repair protein MutS